MAFFTTEDTNNLKILVDHHKSIYRRNALLSRSPHIGSHTVLKVKKCTDEYVYRDPVDLPAVDDDQAEARRDMDNLAIVTDWTFTQTGCDHVVSCNPFHPNSRRCKGMPYFPRDHLTKPSGDTEEHEPPFSFRTLNGQVFDTCQPICYDSAAANTENMIGMMSRFTFGKCRVYDPLMLAFYSDPTRRYINPDTQILERKSFVINDVLIEPYKDAVFLASIPSDYCDQYAGQYTPDGQIQGIDMHKCGEAPLVWSTSWLLGDSLPKLAVLAFDKAGSSSEHEEGARLPPTREFLVSHDQWLKNIDTSKRPLPFPLRLTELGINPGTETEWLVWTDEFSHLDDGRNDTYGGRLVERDRPVPFDIREKYKTTPRGKTTKRARRVKRIDTTTVFENTPTEIQSSIPKSLSNGAPESDKKVNRVKRIATTAESEKIPPEIQSSILKSLSHGAAEYQRILAEDIEHGSFDLLTVGGGVAYGFGYAHLSETLNLPSTFSVLKSAFSAIRQAPAYARKAAVKMVGYWAAKATMAHTTESLFTRTLVKRMKTLAFVQTLGPLALIIDLISLVGLAIDITFVFLNAVGISTPISRRENFVSDRRLYRLAQTEIEFNYRMFGVGNIVMTPHQFVVNTPYITPEEDVQSYMTVMPIVYAAREINSEGSRLKPDQTRDGEFEVGDDGTIHYIKSGVHSATLRDENELSAKVQDVFRTCKFLTKEQDVFQTDKSPSSKDPDDNFSVYYTVALFIATCLISHFYPNKNWTFVLALLISVVSFAFPLVVHKPPALVD